MHLKTFKTHFKIGYQSPQQVFASNHCKHLHTVQKSFLTLFPQQSPPSNWQPALLLLSSQ